MHFYVSRTIRWYVTVEISFIRKSIQGDEQTTATFRTSPEIMADVTAYDPKELLVILFNHVANFLSVDSGWRFDSVQSFAISICPFRPTTGAGSFIDTPKFLYNKGVFNIQNIRDDFCFLLCILAHIHRVDKHAVRTSKYESFMQELNNTGLQFPLKFSDTSKFENLNPTISGNVHVFENNEVFPLYASKQDTSRKLANQLKQRRQVSLPSVRDLSALVHGRTKHDGFTHVCPYCLYCFSEARLLRAHLPDCSIHPEQKVEYHSPNDAEKNIKKFKAIARTLLVPFLIYVDFEAFLVPAEENKESASNTKVRQLHNPSGFACLPVSLVPEFNGEIFTHSGEDLTAVFFEHIRDQDHNVRSILSDVKPMKTLTAEQQLQHAKATNCELCHGQFSKKNK